MENSGEKADKDTGGIRVLDRAMRAERLDNRGHGHGGRLCAIKLDPLQDCIRRSRKRWVGSVHRMGRDEEKGQNKGSQDSAHRLLDINSPGQSVAKRIRSYR